MRAYILGLLAGASVLAFASTASAADLPVRRAPAPLAAVPVFTWTGFYIGANAGYGWAEDDFTLVRRDPGYLTNGDGTDFLPSTSIARDGFLGGLQIGFNYQAGAWVVGLEADLSAMDSHGTFSFAGTRVTPGLNRFPVSLAVRSNLDWLGTLRARAGVAFDRLLIYATGGVSFGSVNYSTHYREDDIHDPGEFAHAIGRSDDVQIGYVLGAGLEYAFTNNLTLRAEYLYYDLGSTNVQTTFVGIDNFSDSFTHKIDTNGHIARLGVNYKF